MNGLIIASIVINGLLTAFTASNHEMPGAFTAVIGLFVALSVVGAIMIQSGSKKAGAIMVIVGCIAFVPIGLIGVYGARKVLDEVKREASQRPGQSVPRPHPVPHAPETAERSTIILPLVLVLGGAALNLLLHGKNYMHTIQFYGLSPLFTDLRFLLFPAMMLADIIGFVLIYRRTVKAGGILVIAANAVYIAARIWTLYVLNASGVEITTYAVTFIGPALLALVGGIFAIRSAVGQESVTRSGPGTYSRGMEG